MTGCIQTTNKYRAYKDHIPLARAIAFEYGLMTGEQLKDSTVFVCHKCNNGKCINPEHLYVGDRSTNSGDMLVANTHNMASKTHCPQGHEYTPENTYHWSNGRKCRECRKQQNAKRYAERVR